MNNKQLDALIRSGENTMKSIGDGLYFRIAKGKPSWVVRYSIGKTRAQIALPKAYPSLSIRDARAEAIRIRHELKLGIDPKSKRKQSEFHVIRTVDHLFSDWHDTYLLRNFKHPEIPTRLYKKEMKRHIGVMTIKDVTPQHIRQIIDEVNLSGRKSIANKVLQYAKQMFNHAIKLNLVTYNPAEAFTARDAGGTEYSRTRILRTDEIAYVLAQMRIHRTIFSRENYLAVCLLLNLGCRKGELISAKWEDIDLIGKIWHCTPNKKAKGAPVEKVAIPLTELVVCWLNELKVRAAGSEYVFPSRKLSRRRGYISDDTLNHALTKMFGVKTDRNQELYPNLMPGVRYFTIHDLRRTCRSLLSQLGVEERIAERCLNHKTSKLVETYDRYHFIKEKRAALQRLSDHLEPLTKATTPLEFKPIY
ncbi:tyrosine-type recombinase/integrase [Vibrio parahaemolyticus]